MSEDLSSIAQNDFEKHVAQDLLDGQQEVVEFTRSTTPIDERVDDSYSCARELVHTFCPVPQIIWRICSYALGRPNQVNRLAEGTLFGLKRLALAIGSDATLGGGHGNLSSVRQVVDAVPSDVIAASAVIHAICRKLQTKELRGAWEPVLNDALLRAHVGFFVGSVCDSFGPGRGMLVGFAGRIGLAILLASGTVEQAGLSLSGLAQGRQLDEITLEVYGTASLHVAGMVLLAAGCGRDALLGVGAYGMSRAHQRLMHPDSRRWLAGFSIVENLRSGSVESIPEDLWLHLEFVRQAERVEMQEVVKMLLQKGHGWEWML